MRHKGGFTGDRLVRSGQSFCLFQAIPLPSLALLGSRDPALAGADSGSLSQPAGVWQDAPGRRQAWPFSFHPCSGMSSLGMKRGLLSGSLPALGAPLAWGRLAAVRAASRLAHTRNDQASSDTCSLFQRFPCGEWFVGAGDEAQAVQCRVLTRQISGTGSSVSTFISPPPSSALLSPPRWSKLHGRQEESLLWEREGKGWLSAPSLAGCQQRLALCLPGIFPS